MGEIKKPAEAGRIQDIKNNHVTNDTECCRRVQVFRRELPKIIPSCLSIEQKIEFLGDLIPTIEIDQKRKFAESLQTAYLMELEVQGQYRRY